MADRNISAYFRTQDAAESIVPKLMALRAKQVNVDSIPANRSYNSMLYPGAMLGLGAMAPGVDFSSEMGYGVFGELPVGFLEEYPYTEDTWNTLLTAQIDEESYTKAAHLIETGGGDIR
ncbi:MAG: hypothetical protein K0R75_2618 [Paenibacillaceae bacterium]|jgi:hypothetical protein|nr:hypothetical protein [Paenibacillaceae bacterium]